MLIHRVYGLILPRFRRRRFEKFVAALSPERATSILDVGGLPDTWTSQSALPCRIEVLNLEAPDFDQAAHPNHRVTAVSGDATSLPYEDGSFSIAFSNSVIEHVGDDAAQERFASEIRRIGHDIWVQTPAQEFFFEPHFLAPFFHWLPIEVRHRVGRLTPWAIITRASKAEVSTYVDEVRLLNRSRMSELFPDCEIHVEKSLGMRKSYIAIRQSGSI